MLSASGSAFMVLSTKYLVLYKLQAIYGVRQNKISQRENRDIYIMQKYFYTKFSTFIYHMSSQDSLILLN